MEETFMIAYINGIRVEGTPEEIERFRQLSTQTVKKSNTRLIGDPYGVYDKDGNWDGDL